MSATPQVRTTITYVYNVCCGPRALGGLPLYITTKLLVELGLHVLDTLENVFNEGMYETSISIMAHSPFKKLCCLEIICMPLGKKMNKIQSHQQPPLTLTLPPLM